MKQKLSWLFRLLLADYYTKPKYKDNLKSIEKVGDLFPLLYNGCFEYYLGNEEGRIDVNVCITYEFGEHKLNMDLPALESLISSDEKMAHLKPILTFWENWGNGKILYAPLIDYVWLVFDIEDNNPISITPWHYTMFHANAITRDKQVKSAIIKNLLDELGFTTDHFESYNRVFSNFPDATIIRSLGLKSYHNNKLIRLYVIGEDLKDLYELLENNHWPGNAETLKSQLASFAGMCFKYALALDIGPDVMPKIGLEFYPHRHHFHAFMQQLAEQGLCQEETLHDLLLWTGELELETLSDTSTVLNHNGIGNTPAHHDNLHEKFKVKRSIPLVKFIYEEGKPLVAKAYLYHTKA